MINGRDYEAAAMVLAHEFGHAAYYGPDGFKPGPESLRLAKLIVDAAFPTAIECEHPSPVPMRNGDEVCGACGSTRRWFRHEVST